MQPSNATVLVYFIVSTRQHVMLDTSSTSGEHERSVSNLAPMMDTGSPHAGACCRRRAERYWHPVDERRLSLQLEYEIRLQNLSKAHYYQIRISETIRDHAPPGNRYQSDIHCLERISMNFDGTSLRPLYLIALRPAREHVCLYPSAGCNIMSFRRAALGMTH